MSDEWNGVSLRLITLLSATMALGIGACTSEESPTEPSASTSPARAAVAVYTAVDLGTLAGGIESQAMGVMTDLGTLGGAFSRASGINPAGNVVGVSTSTISVGGQGTRTHQAWGLRGSMSRWDATNGSAGSTASSSEWAYL